MHNWWWFRVGLLILKIYTILVCLILKCCVKLQNNSNQPYKYIFFFIKAVQRLKIFHTAKRLLQIKKIIKSLHITFTISLTPPYHRFFPLDSLSLDYTFPSLSKAAEKKTRSIRNAYICGITFVTYGICSVRIFAAYARNTLIFAVCFKRMQIVSRLMIKVCVCLLQLRKAVRNEREGCRWWRWGRIRQKPLWKICMNIMCGLCLYQVSDVKLKNKIKFYKKLGISFSDTLNELKVHFLLLFVESL